MRILSLLRPTPGKLIEKAIPMYLMETERPLASQAMLAGSVCYMLNITDRPLITIVIARAITSGCIVAAHTTAKHLSEKKFSASEAEYSKFRESILTHVVGSIEPLKDKMIKATDPDYGISSVNSNFNNLYRLFRTS
jgi:hypothetical protein